MTVPLLLFLRRRKSELLCLKKKTPTNDLFKTTRNETRNEITDEALRLEMRSNCHKTKC